MLSKSSRRLLLQVQPGEAEVRDGSKGVVRMGADFCIITGRGGGGWMCEGAKGVSLSCSQDDFLVEERAVEGEGLVLASLSAHVAPILAVLDRGGRGYTERGGGTHLKGSGLSECQMSTTHFLHSAQRTGTLYACLCHSSLFPSL